MVGAETGDVLLALLRSNPEIEAVNVFDYDHPPLLQERLRMTLEERALVDTALEARRQTNLPFWEALLLACFDQPSGYERLLDHALYHQRHRNELVTVTRAAVEAGALHQPHHTMSARPRSLSSLVVMSGGREMHMMLMDFHCPETVNNDRLVSKACRLLFNGLVYVLASGESYHAIGSRIVDWATLRDCLTRSLLLAPIIDTRYVTHQLMEGACALRLGPSSVKSSRPTVKVVLEA